MIRFKKSTLSNGIRVVSELHSASRAVSIGIWTLVGTRHEGPKDAGISHFLEHLVFKGTKTRSAFQIAKSLEALGGDLNAFTSRENTCYHCLVLKDHWKIGLEVLADLVSNMNLRKEDFKLEKSVILQEIAMGEDNLEELAYDLYLEKSLVDHPLSKPILGTHESISAMTQAQIKNYYSRNYTGSQLIVSAVGQVHHEELVEAVEDFLGQKKKRKFVNSISRPRHRAFRAMVDKPGEQLHFLAGLPSTSFKDKHRFEAFIVNALLGGGMTSRLYQSVRERKGLVYSVNSSLNTFEDFGLINIYAACEPEKMKEVVDQVAKELKRLRKSGITESDLKLFKTQVIGSILLGADDVENRMQSLAVNEMVFGKYKSVDAIIEEMSSVTVKSVNQFIKDYLQLDQIGALLVGAEASGQRNWFTNYSFK